MLLGEESLQCTNGDGLIDLTAAARCFAGMGTDSSTDTRQRIGLTRVAVGFFKVAFRNQRDVPPRVGMRGAGHHAGEIGIEPISIYLFVNKPLQHVWPLSAS